MITIFNIRTPKLSDLLKLTPLGSYTTGFNLHLSAPKLMLFLIHDAASLYTAGRGQQLNLQNQLQSKNMWPFVQK